MSDRLVLVVPGRAILGALLAIALVLALVPGPRDALNAAIGSRTVAPPALIEQQRGSAADAIQRGYLKATGQLTEVRKLTLAIDRATADAVEARARNDLAALRRDALAAVGRATGVPEIESYVSTILFRSDQGGAVGQGGTLLAPSLFAVVARADELFAQVADSATRELTGAPTPSPTSSP